MLGSIFASFSGVFCDFLEFFWIFSPFFEFLGGNFSFLEFFWFLVMFTTKSGIAGRAPKTGGAADGRRCVGVWMSKSAGDDGF